MARTSGDNRSGQGIPGARERFYATPGAPGDGGTTLLAVFLAFVILLLTASLSVRQATEPRPAQRVLEAGIASLTDIDLLLAEHGNDLKHEAESGTAATFNLPGYPIDVFLSRDEVIQRSIPELRSLILARSAGAVYAEGLSAFDRTGHQSLSLFSAQGALDFAVGHVSRETNSAAGTASIVLALVTGALALALVMRVTGYRRFRTLGLAVVAGALPGLLLVLAVRFAANNIGHNDPFMAQLRLIVTTLLAVPMRNYLVVAVLGAVIAALAPVFSLIEGPLAPREADEAPTDWESADFAEPGAETAEPAKR
jgi:hypothetical protein